MGTWGLELYQDDIASDIKTEYKDKLHKGKTNEEALYEIIEENREIIEDKDEAPLFWFALADTQWDLGRLDEYVKKEALRYIETQADLANWNEDINLYKNRVKILQNLKCKLLTPQPMEKRIKQYSLYRCEWNMGDIFIYQLNGKESIQNKLNGQYLIIQKVDEMEWYHGDIIPIVRIKITKDRVIPKTEIEINELEYIQTDYCLYERRYWGISGDIPLDEQISDKSFETDEYGLLPEFLVALVITSESKKAFLNQLTYIGNYNSIEVPEKEFVPLNKLNIATTMCDNLEKEIIEKYLGNNKRQYEIYKEKKN